MGPYVLWNHAIGVQHSKCHELVLCWNAFLTWIILCAWKTSSNTSSWYSLKRNRLIQSCKSFTCSLRWLDLAEHQLFLNLVSLNLVWVYLTPGMHRQGRQTLIYSKENSLASPEIIMFPSFLKGCVTAGEDLLVWLEPHMHSVLLCECTCAVHTLSDSMFTRGTGTGFLPAPALFSPCIKPRTVAVKIPPLLWLYRCCSFQVASWKALQGHTTTSASASPAIHCTTCHCSTNALVPDNPRQRL